MARAYRRAGVGKVFMNALHEIARSERCSRVAWTTDAPTEVARAFYESLGFTENALKIFHRSTL